MFYSSKFLNFLSLINAFSWLEADLKVLLMYKLICMNFDEFVCPTDVGEFAVTNLH